ncbi:hypothetical protein Pmani_026007 [Petrolisthes manimaculis]|uniref:Uncharacterized protein n=1 Tax=Petrolisthes manimaculis TaxID=1843537 RepID=A0AAE1U0K7_9EUCA|nr:hypothetical protein Pmani_026007 [Petrolisthes manimaculis]
MPTAPSQQSNVNKHEGFSDQSTFRNMWRYSDSIPRAQQVHIPTMTTLAPLTTPPSKAYYYPIAISNAYAALYIFTFGTIPAILFIAKCEEYHKTPRLDSSLGRVKGRE